VRGVALACAALLACSPERAPDAPVPIAVASTTTPDASIAPEVSPPARDGGPCITARAMMAGTPDVIDLGRPANWRPAPNEGPGLPGPNQQGPAVRVTMTAFDAPDDVDGFQVAAYLPYYVAKAYQAAVEKDPKLAGDVEVVATLAVDGTPRDVRVRAPGFPAPFVYDVTSHASGRWFLCQPLTAPSPVRLAMSLTRR